MCSSKSTSPSIPAHVIPFEREPISLAKPSHFQNKAPSDNDEDDEDDADYIPNPDELAQEEPIFSLKHNLGTDPDHSESDEEKRDLKKRKIADLVADIKSSADARVAPSHSLRNLHTPETEIRSNAPSAGSPQGNSVKPSPTKSLSSEEPGHQPMPPKPRRGPVKRSSGLQALADKVGIKLRASTAVTAKPRPASTISQSRATWTSIVSSDDRLEMQRYNAAHGHLTHMEFLNQTDQALHNQLKELREKDRQHRHRNT
jgi:hypothetical protein